MARLFFALWPDDESRNQLFNIVNQFKNEDIKLVKKSNLHMTLEFLGEVSDEVKTKLITEITKKEIDINSFEINLTRIGYWKKPKILFIGTTQIPEPLLTLVKVLRKTVKLAGLKPETREYKPHITVARKAKKVLVPTDTFEINWQINSFSLVESVSTEDGIKYEPVKSWTLLDQ